MDGDPRPVGTDAGVTERGARAAPAGGPAVRGDAPTVRAPAPARRPEGVRDLIPWVTEIAFVTGIVVMGWLAFLILTSGENPFATVVIPIILVLTVIAAVARYRWIRRHREDAGIVHARHVARERRGF